MTKDPMNVHVGRNIRLHRQRNGLTLSGLAGVLGTTHQQLQRYESGLNGTSASTLYHIAIALEVDVRVFYEGLEYNPELDREHEIHWTTLRAAEILEGMPMDDLRANLQDLIRTLSAEPGS